MTKKTKSPEQRAKANEYHRQWRKANIKRHEIVKESLNNLPEDAKPIPTYPSYFATPNGDVYRIAPPRITGFTTIPSRIIKITQATNSHVPYKQCQLYKNGKRVIVYTHRLLLETFKGMPIGDRVFCNHINGITSDNRIENLEWVSRQENNERKVNPRGKYTHLKEGALADYDAGMPVADIVRKYSMRASHHIYGWLNTRKNKLKNNQD